MTLTPLVPLALAALLVTACSGAGSQGASTAGGAVGAPAPLDLGAPDGATTDGLTGGGEGGSEEGGGGDAGAVAVGRVGAATASVVRTGQLEVVVDDVAAAAGDAARLVRDGGGAVAADSRSRDGGREQAALVLRVQPDDFDATVERLADLGEERSRSLGSEDVTEQVVDLDSRLATQRASVERVRALLAEADTLGEVVQVEGELTRRTAELESLQARLAALTAQVDLGTLELRLTASEDAPAAGGALGFGDGLREGWDALRTVARAAGVALGAVLPFTPLLAVGGLLVWRSRRRPAV